MAKSGRAQRAPAGSKRGAYHHGNLRDALIDVAVEMIGTSGVSGFSMAEACRRLNVTVGAPYRHFADRGALLTAVAVRGCETLATLLSPAAVEQADPVEHLALLARGYVRFAAENPALFDTLYAKEVFFPGNVELAEAMLPVVEAFVVPARTLEESSPELTLRLVVGVAAVTHGYAAFLRTGSFTGSDDPFRAAADNAAFATRALIAGREELKVEQRAPEMMLAGLSADLWVRTAARVLTGAAR
ncbi:TetR/AcrR family transcriptional regulator [Actinomadura madurae]|uniref:TetR/AcrR family transcriptional regulator n=1 Tax=Actinomadura madurae TaxID=1993 RepID=UPI002026E16D|nr:TetR/AcrR family transcriptional regulator [Actinomadura madurae]URN00925.1 TetR/AcrR family transcriptional regulator [Actinomadura madurae]URN03075.1 TetR/AcrR family transcriptional regulator [Actinomadura madurae]